MPQQQTPPFQPRGYPPEAAGLDPVAVPRDPEAGGATFSEVTSPRFSPQAWPDDGVRARDEFYYHERLSSTEAFKRKHFSIFTWAMIVVAGIVLGGSMALMAAGA
ncbi:MAG TPA: hypothetical protein VGO52_06535 [Hyphomonadaceae bacterium]|jgi:hypothetical protein|nr:hypothetical protein [Hyphomonadaceae bacterium]